jgi:hypothetical protein
MKVKAGVGVWTHKIRIPPSTSFKNKTNSGIDCYVCLRSDDHLSVTFNGDKGNKIDIVEVRGGEERGDENHASLDFYTRRAPLPMPQYFSPIIPTLFAIRLAHRRTKSLSFPRRMRLRS